MRKAGRVCRWQYALDLGNWLTTRTKGSDGKRLLSSLVGFRLNACQFNAIIRLNVSQNIGRFTEFMNEAMQGAEARGTKLIDPRPFVEEASRLYGVAGMKVAIELFHDLDAALHRSPWTQYRRVEWVDVVQLEDLFRSESLETSYGTFVENHAPKGADFIEHYLRKPKRAFDVY